MRFTGAASAAVAVLSAAGCGMFQGHVATDPKGTFPVSVVSASFPSSQRLSKPAVMHVTVRNAGTKTVPNLAVSVINPKTGTTANAFAQSNQQVGLQARSRAIWIVDSAPKGGETAYANTWATGPLKPGKSETMTWHVTATKPGTYHIEYRVAAGLGGRAIAVNPGGGPVQGAFTVRIAGAPAQTTVSDNGKVVPSR